MVGKKLKAFAKEMALAFDDQKVYGVYDDYLLSIAENDNVRTLYVDIACDESLLPQMTEVRDFLSDGIDQYSIQSFDIKPTGIRVDTAIKGVSFESFIDLFYNLLTQLKDNGVPGYTVCSSCGEPISGEPKIVAIGNYVHSCDADCAGQLVSSYRRTKKENPAAFVPRENKEPAHAGAGLIGAIFGSLFGAVLWVAAHHYGLGAYAVAAGLLVGLLAHAGFRLFGGRRSGARFAICTIVPSLFVILAEFASFCVVVGANWTKEGVVYRFFDLLGSVFQSIITKGDVQAVFLRESLMGIALVVLVAVLFTLIKPKQPSARKESIEEPERDPNEIVILDY